jgi:hypothetical protein
VRSVKPCGAKWSAANNGQPPEILTEQDLAAIHNGIHCAGQALKAKGLSIVLDAVGAIPGAGNLVSGAAVGIRAADAYVSGIGALSGAGLVLLNPTDRVDVASGATNLGLAFTNIALGGTKAIPVAGNIVSGLTGLYDAYGAVQVYHQCVAGTN